MSVFSGGRGHLKRQSTTTDVGNSIDEKTIFNLETEEETETTPQQVTR